MAGGPVDADPLEHLATEADDRRRKGVDRDLEGQDDGAVGIDPDDRRGPAGRALRLCSLLDHEVGRGKLADQPTDRTAGQAGAGDQLGAGCRTTEVELTDDRAQVRAADRLAALTDRLQPHRHRICVPFFQTL